MALSTPLLVLFEGAIAHVICQRYAGQPVTVGHALRRTVSRFFSMFEALLLAILAVTAMAISIIEIPFAIYFGVPWRFLIAGLSLGGI